MEKYNLRPCGVRNCYRNKHSVSLCSISIVSTSDKDTSGVSSNFRAGSSKPASERGNMRGSLYKRRFLQSVIFNPQKGREYASSYRSEPPKLLYRNPPLNCFIRNPPLNYSKVSPEARSFHDEVTSEERVPFGGYTPSE